MSKLVTLENIRPGGFGLPTGQIIPGGGTISVEPEIWDASKDHPVVKAKVEDGSLIVDGKGRKKGTGSDAGGEDIAELQKRFEASQAALTSELNAANAKVAELTTTVGERDAEILRLKEGGSSAPLKAEHHGGGKFNITRGEKVLASNLSKADADAFNALDDEAKAAKVAELTKAK